MIRRLAQPQINSVPDSIPRDRFRELIDPLLEACGTTADQVRSCEFDGERIFAVDDDGTKLALGDQVLTVSTQVLVI